MKLKSALGILILATVSSTAASKAPVTPRLSAETYTRLTADLTRLGFPGNGQNSVAVALTTALGTKPASTEYLYSLMSYQLPKVKVGTIRKSKRCADVEARAWFNAPSKVRPVRIAGTYCLGRDGGWSASPQLIELAAP